MSQAALERQMYLSVQCVRMKDALLHELAHGPNDEWHEPARKELSRRAGTADRTVFHGQPMTPNG